MTQSLIQYGISKNYISSWGYKEAIREIVQNFMDYGEYECDDSSMTHILYSSNYQTDDFEFLKIGFSQKHNSESVGKYGEGIKMALLVLARLEIDVSIQAVNSDGVCTSLTPTFYDDEVLGSDCFGIEVNEIDYDCDGYVEMGDNTFLVSIEKDPEYDDMEGYFINSDTEVIFSSGYGDIVDMPEGNIYVGGIYVTNYPEMTRSYNLKPSHVDLGRDRNFPCSYDIESATSSIYEKYVEDDNSQLDNYCYHEVAYLSSLPKSYTDEVKPIMMHGEMKYKHSNGLVPDVLLNAVKNTDTVKKQVANLNIHLTKRKSPHDLLSTFFNNHRYMLGQSARAELDLIVEKSKNWT